MPETMDKERWIDGVLNSTEGMRKAEPEANFYQQVLQKINRPATVKGVTMPLKQWAAAAILLLALNISSIVYFMDHGRKAGNMGGGNPLAAEMQLGTTYNY